MLGWTDRLLLVAGAATWAAVGVPALGELARDPARLWHARGLAWLIAFLAYGASYCVGGLVWARERARGSSSFRAICPPLLVVQTAAALTILVVGDGTIDGALLVVIAGTLPLVVSRWVAAGWVALDSVALTGILATRPETSAARTWGFIGFQLFAFSVSYIAESEAQARRDLGQVNAELVATRHLLAESVRACERRRISDELHDSIGHHLAILSASLEAAARLAGPAAEHIERARASARRLFSDLRDVVGSLQASALVDLPARLQVLAADVREPRVSLSLPDRLEIEDPALAEAVFRCVQEIITNAVKHARATNLWIEIAQSPGLLDLRARDDGVGARQLADAGRGLGSMRERLEKLGGELSVAAEPGRGFRLHARLPTERGSA
jgi:signal transduction histidine kinase